MAILTLDKVDIQTKHITKDKEGHFIVTQNFRTLPSKKFMYLIASFKTHEIKLMNCKLKEANPQS